MPLLRTSCPADNVISATVYNTFCYQKWPKNVAKNRDHPKQITMVQLYFNFILILQLFYHSE